MKRKTRSPADRAVEGSYNTEDKFLASESSGRLSIRFVRASSFLGGRPFWQSFARSSAARADNQAVEARSSRCPGQRRAELARNYLNCEARNGSFAVAERSLTNQRETLRLTHPPGSGRWAKRSRQRGRSRSRNRSKYSLHRIERTRAIPRAVLTGTGQPNSKPISLPCLIRRSQRLADRQPG